MSKHTPGPWEMRLSDNATPFIQHGKDAYLHDIDDPDHLVCVMPAKITRDFNSFANAYLIAAAPELLEALEMILQNWPVERDGMDSEILPVGVKNARAIVAKAKVEVMP